jgi:hypothetical protein
MAKQQYIMVHFEGGKPFRVKIKDVEENQKRITLLQERAADKQLKRVMERQMSV